MLEFGEFRKPKKNEPKVVLAFSYRYDSQLVPDLLKNLEPAVHAWVAWDDSKSPPDVSDEPARRRQLLAGCRDIGGDWVLTADPDERFEDRLRHQMRRLARPEQDVIWSFHLREMYTPTAFRSDSIWGRKERPSLYPLTSDAVVPDKLLHGRWLQYPSDKQLRHSGLNFYHLRMITPERRRARRDYYAAHDPERAHQTVGYDYLDDERTLRLTEIEPTNAFSPPHIETGHLWAGDDPLPRPPEPDRDWNRFHFLRRLNRSEDAAMRGVVALDIEKNLGDDLDQICIAARFLMSAGQFEAAEAALAKLPKDDLFRLISLTQIQLRKGDRQRASVTAAAALTECPGSRLTQMLVARCAASPEHFASSNAVWRRWIRGAAGIHEGDHVTDARQAVVVIGYGAPRELAEAVSSLREQDEPVEIVVVNSGGGNALRVLRDHLADIRLIDVAERLYVGAARNIGIDASMSPIIGFLASDCTACPGWVSQRLKRHADGYAAVSSSVVPANDRSLASLTASAVLHWRRWPMNEANNWDPHGLSYDRWVFDEWGFFSPDLRVSEDTVLNRQLAGRVRVAQAPDVVTTHKYPTRVAGLLWDSFLRGKRRAPHVIGSKRSTLRDRRQNFLSQRRWRHLDARRESFRLEGVGRVRRGVIRQLIRLASYADFFGLISEAKRVQNAEDLADRAEEMLVAGKNPEVALRFASEARDLCPQVGRFQLLEAEALAAQKPPVSTDRLVAAFERAAGLLPNSSRPAQRLHDILLERGEAAVALRCAERFHELAPWQHAHCVNAAKSAAGLDHLALASFYGRLALARAPWEEDVHRCLHDIHTCSGRRALAGFRLKHADRFADRATPATGGEN